MVFPPGVNLLNLLNFAFLVAEDAAVLGVDDLGVVLGYLCVGATVGEALAASFGLSLFVTLIVACAEAVFSGDGGFLCQVVCGMTLAMGVAEMVGEDDDEEEGYGGEGEDDDHKCFKY